MASEYSLELPLALRPRNGEAELVARAAAGDHEAYASLLRPHERIAFRAGSLERATKLAAEASR